MKLLFFFPVLLGLFFAGGASAGSESLPVTEGLVGWWLADDLSESHSSGEPVDQWPDHEKTGALLYVDGNTPPTFRTAEDTGLKTAAVHFDNLPDNAPPNFDPGIAQFLNIPNIYAVDLPWREITVILAGRGLDMHTFQIGPTGGPQTFRHIYMQLQLYDKNWAASIEWPIRKMEAEMPCVFAAVVDHDPSADTTTLQSYVNGLQTGEALLQPREETSPEPFEGIAFGQTSITRDGVPYPDSAIGIAGRPVRDAEYFAILLYDRSLSAEEVAEVSRFLAEKF